MEIYMIIYKQLTLADPFENCQEILVSDNPKYLSLLEKHFNLDSIFLGIIFTHRQTEPTNTL